MLEFLPTFLSKIEAVYRQFTSGLQGRFVGLQAGAFGAGVAVELLGFLRWRFAGVVVSGVGLAGDCGLKFVDARVAKAGVPVEVVGV